MTARTEAVLQSIPQGMRMSSILSRLWSACNSMYDHKRQRQLRISETISLGEKRFLAVIEVDGERLLIGGSATSVSLLTRLAVREAREDLEDVSAASFNQELERVREACRP